MSTGLGRGSCKSVNCLCQPSDFGWCGGQTLARGARATPLGGRSAPVAQLDRALPSEGRGQRFESSRVRQGGDLHQRVSPLAYHEGSKLVRSRSRAAAQTSGALAKDNPLGCAKAANVPKKFLGRNAG